MHTITAGFLTEICHQKIGQKAELYKNWWGRIGQALTLYREDNKEKLMNYYKKESSKSVDILLQQT